MLFILQPIVIHTDNGTGRSSIVSGACGRYPCALYALHGLRRARDTRFTSSFNHHEALLGGHPLTLNSKHILILLV